MHRLQVIKYIAYGTEAVHMVLHTFSAFYIRVEADTEESELGLEVPLP